VSKPRAAWPEDPVSREPQPVMPGLHQEIPRITVKVRSRIVSCVYERGLGVRQPGR
jgi:hypothetical protein